MIKARKGAPEDSVACPAGWAVAAAICPLGRRAPETLGVERLGDETLGAVTDGALTEPLEIPELETDGAVIEGDDTEGGRTEELTPDGRLGVCAPPC